ncbi:hypothetical protein GCM10025867_51110 (plasmid) [Frondihabitans sucicola]|uniref:Uncharacterized protein n=1 Tax=Frondihabitans sucicola TaxID=1268041 RepID=A0ABM8GV37_9MICO|nr:hypothetical protein [Frondihabitans sucicola]BDZ52303.1 hypothetical protein GCM10025867_45440 [Frondihabitans sucicola]BDZ52870.1 hypothetical protein GCM10025867_51110 [Frondihabitans sucicola]
MSELTSRPEVDHIVALHRTVTDHAELIARDLERLALKVREEATSFTVNADGAAANSERAHSIGSMVTSEVAGLHLSAFHHRAAELDVLIATERGAHKGWDEGRSSVGVDMAKPLDADGMRPTSSNPHGVPHVQVEGNYFDDVALILKHCVFAAYDTPGESHDSWTNRAQAFPHELVRIRNIADDERRARELAELASFALGLLSSGALTKTAPTRVRVLMNARRPGMREQLLTHAGDLT